MLKLILCGAFINSITGPNGTVLLMGNKSHMELFNGFFKFVIIVVVIFFYGKKYFWGVALAISLSDILVNLMKTIEVYYLYKIIPFNYRESLFIIFISILGIFLFYFTFMDFFNKCWEKMTTFQVVVISWPKCICWH